MLVLRIMFSIGGMCGELDRVLISYQTKLYCLLISFCWTNARPAQVRDLYLHVL